METPRLDKAMAKLNSLTDELSRSLPFKDIWSNFQLTRAPQFEWPSLTIGNLTASVPIVQGGMGLGISLSKLASAVANTGGIGVVAANCIGLLEKNYYKDGRAANLRAFRREIRETRRLTDGIIGVNIMVAMNDFYQLLDVAIEEKVDLIIMGAGLPVKNMPVERIRENNVKVAPIVSSARAAKLIFKMWKKSYNDIPDAVVFEGPLAGGHLGFSREQIEDPEYQLETIVPQVVEALKPFEADFGRKIPVIAGGGVYTGKDIHKVLKLGAAGVQMGTRFVATEECDADHRFKEAYVNCTSADIGLIDSPVGMPGRAIRNEFIEATEQGLKPAFRCAWQCLNSCKADKAHYCISIALNNARLGNLKHGFVFCGTNAHRVTEIITVPELMGELTQSFKAQLQESMTQKLENLVTRVQDLRQQYDGIGARVREVRLAYETALIDRFQSAKETSIESIRTKYDTTLASLQELQFEIAESLADSWALLNLENRLAIDLA